MAPLASFSAEAGPSNWNKASSEAPSSRRPRSQSLDPVGSYRPAQPRPPIQKVGFSFEPSGARASGEASSSVSPRTKPLDPASSHPPVIQLSAPILKVGFSNESAAAAPSSKKRASSEPFNFSPSPPRSSSEPLYDTISFHHHLRIIPTTPTESDPPEIGSPPARKLRFSVSSTLAKITTRRTSAEKKPAGKSDEAESPEIAEEKEEELPSFIIVNGIRIFVDKNRNDKARERETSGGSHSTTSSASRNDKGKSNDNSRRPSSVTLNSKNSNPSLLKPIDSLVTLNEMEKHPCTPGDYTIYRERDGDDLRGLYVAMRKEGFDIPYAPFEPEYVEMKYYTVKPQSCILQISLLGSFVCWWMAIGGVLSYRIWGMHVGYSKKWHWTSIHQDLRFDDREWKLFVGSAGVLAAFFAVITAACLWGFGEKLWKDLAALGVFKVCQLFKQWRKKVNFREKSGDALRESRVEEGRGVSGRKQQNERKSRWEWDLDWEERMIYTYSKMIWAWVVRCFMLLPIVLVLVYWVVMLRKGKCFAHDKTGGFGW